MSNIDSPKLLAIAEILEQSYAHITETRNSQHKALDLLVLLIVNQSTSDALSDRAFASLKARYPSYLAILQENNPTTLASSIKLCGLSQSKANYILSLLKTLYQQGELDLELAHIQNMDDSKALKYLTSFKGVGIKSASCLLMFAFARNTFPIDTHIQRIFQRLGIMQPKLSLSKAHQCIQPLLQEHNAFVIHVALIEIGRTVCLPRLPACAECPMQPHCRYHQQLGQP